MKKTQTNAIENFAWAVDARSRSQRLMVSLYGLGERSHERFQSDPLRIEVFSLCVGAAFSLWRAAFLADMKARTWERALPDALSLIRQVLTTNTVTFGTERELREWVGGYYLNNAKFRIQEALKKHADVSLKRSAATALAAVERIDIIGTDPQVTWNLLCYELETLVQRLSD